MLELFFLLGEGKENRNSGRNDPKDVIGKLPSNLSMLLI